MPQPHTCYSLSRVSFSLVDPMDELSDSFRRLVLQQAEWNPYWSFPRWIPFVVPPILMVIRGRRSLWFTSFVVLACALICGWFFGSMGDHSLRVLKLAAANEADQTWVAQHDALLMLPIQGFLYGIGWSSLVAGLCYLVVNAVEKNHPRRSGSAARSPHEPKRSRLTPDGDSRR